MKARLFICIAALSVATAALAANVEVMVRYKSIQESSEGQGQLDKSVKLFFGPHSAPADAKVLGDLTLNKIASDKNRHDFDGNCRLAVLQALVELQSRAKSAGGDAVGNILSSYKGGDSSSAEEAECHAGGTGGHLTLKAQLLKLN